MLNCRKITSGNETAAADYYATENRYYSDQAQGGLRIQGTLAAYLGFQPGEQITANELAALLAGRDRSGEDVLAKREKHRVSAYDLTFSPDKSVSVAVLDDQRLIDAHHRAVSLAMAEIEARYLRGRDRSGTNHEGDGRAAWATATDNLSRSGDPHLHTHAIVLNMSERGGKVAALDGKKLLRRDVVMLGGEIYRQVLRREVSALGYSTSETKNGWRLDAVSIDLCRELSSRRNEITAALGRAALKKGDGVILSARERERIGIAGGTVEEVGERIITITAANGCRADIPIAGTDAAAWAMTRVAKDNSPGSAEAVQHWRAVAAKYKTSVEHERQRAAIEYAQWRDAAAYSLWAQHGREGKAESEREAWGRAAVRATARQAWASREAMLYEYLRERGDELLTIAQAEERLEQAKQTGILAHDGAGRFTSWDLVEADRKCVLALDHAVSAELVRADADKLLARVTACDSGRVPLDSEQQEAVRAILASERGVVAIQGTAGAGKSTMCRALKSAADIAGIEVIGASVAGKAAANLRDSSGIQSYTMVGLLNNYDKQQPGSRKPRVVVVDEASMVGTRAMARLLERAAAHGDKIVLMGDRAQLSAINAGRPFERIQEQAAVRGELLTLTSNHRQTNPVLREAVEYARRGQMAETIRVLDEAGAVIEYDSETDKNTGISRHEVIAEIFKRGDLVLTCTRTDRDRLNAAIRSRQVLSGEVAAGSATVVTYKDEDGIEVDKGISLGAGDRVVFKENDRRFGICNGDTGTVVSMSGDGALDVRHDDGREISMGNYRALDHGYALTTASAQGQTCQRVIIDAATAHGVHDARSVYVQISRAREQALIFTDDKERLLENVQDMAVPMDTLGFIATTMASAITPEHELLAANGNHVVHTHSQATRRPVVSAQTSSSSVAVPTFEQFRKMPLRQQRAEWIRRERDAYTDSLTGARSRAWAERHSIMRMETIDVHGGKVVRPVIANGFQGMIDIDRFKLINDTWGHAYGDAFLRRTVEYLQEKMVGKAEVIRFGGEEILIWPRPGVSNHAVVAAVDSAREEFQRTLINTPDGRRRFSFSAGFGLTQQAADEALYNAKHAGRNRVYTEEGMYGRQRRAEVYPERSYREQENAPTSGISSDVGGTIGNGLLVSPDREDRRPEQAEVATARQALNDAREVGRRADAEHSARRIAHLQGRTYRVGDSMTPTKGTRRAAEQQPRKSVWTITRESYIEQAGKNGADVGAAGKMYDRLCSRIDISAEDKHEIVKAALGMYTNDRDSRRMMRTKYVCEDYRIDDAARRTKAARAPVPNEARNAHDDSVQKMVQNNLPKSIRAVQQQQEGEDNYSKQHVSENEASQ